MNYESEVREDSLLARLGYQGSLRPDTGFGQNRYEASVYDGGGSADLDMGSKLGYRNAPLLDTGTLEAQLEDVNDDLDAIDVLLMGESAGEDDEDYESDGDEDLEEAVSALVEYSMLLAEHAPDLCDEAADFANIYNETLAEGFLGIYDLRLHEAEDTIDFKKRASELKSKVDSLVSKIPKLKNDLFIMGAGPALPSSRRGAKGLTFYGPIMVKLYKQAIARRFQNKSKFGRPGLTGADFKAILSIGAKDIVQALKKAGYGPESAAAKGGKSVLRTVAMQYFLPMVYKKERAQFKNSLLKALSYISVGTNLVKHYTMDAPGKFLKGAASKVWNAGKSFVNKLRGVQEELHREMLQSIQEG